MGTGTLFFVAYRGSFFSAEHPCRALTCMHVVHSSHSKSSNTWFIHLIQSQVTRGSSFNCAVSLNAASSSAHISQHIQKIPNFPPPFSFIRANPSVFLDDSLRFRSFICLAADARIDRHNAFTITGDGCMHMLLDRDTFTSLGLCGAVCKFDEHRWSCSVQLKSANANAIERARNCLQRCPSVPWVCCFQTQSLQEAFKVEQPVFHANISFVHSLTHSAQLTCDSSLSCRCRVETSEVSGCCPLFEDDSWLKAITAGDKEPLLELLEWAGAVHAECSNLMCGGGDARPVLASHRPCNLHQIRIEGLLAPCTISSVVATLVDEVSSSALPWVLLTLFGHEDSPSAWSNSQHAAALNGGECHVTILLFKNNSSEVLAIVFESIGAADSRV
jgi:hypothetical protein